MLRCSSLIFSIAVCLVCTPNLFGQAQYNPGFPSRLAEALDKNAPAATEGRVERKAGGRRAMPVSKAFGSRKSRDTIANQNSKFVLPPSAPQQKSASIHDEKGVPFKPTPGYKKFEINPASSSLSSQAQTQSPLDIKGIPFTSKGETGSFESKPKPKHQPRFSEPTGGSRFPLDISIPNEISAKPTSTTQAAPVSSAETLPALSSTPLGSKSATPQSSAIATPTVSAPIDKPTASMARQKVSDIDPKVRREIEEQVKRDLEEKFESQIQNLVQKQVREQVRDAQQKLERAARNSRVASRPLSSSTYRAPGSLRQPPSIKGEVLPMIVPGNSQVPKRSQNHAHYLISDGASGINSYQQQMNSNPLPKSGGQIPAPPQANQRESAPVRELFKDSRLKPASEPNLVASNEPEQASNAAAQTQSEQFMLRTSVVGPGALLKGQSDDYEISVSNVSNQPATNIIVQLTVPDEITISRLDRDAYLDQIERTVSWKIASIPGGQREVIKYRAVSSSAGEYEQQVTLGMENTFQGKTPFTTVVQVGAPSMSVERDYVEVAEAPQRLDFEE